MVTVGVMIDGVSGALFGISATTGTCKSGVVDGSRGVATLIGAEMD